jgi:hypothetical protein
MLTKSVKLIVTTLTSVSPTVSSMKVKLMMQAILMMQMLPLWMHTETNAKTYIKDVKVSRDGF